MGNRKSVFKFVRICEDKIFLILEFDTNKRSMVRVQIQVSHKL